MALWIAELQHVGKIGCGPCGIHGSWGKQLPTAGRPTSRRFRSDGMLERRQSQSLRERCTDLSISPYVVTQRSMSRATHEGNSYDMDMFGGKARWNSTKKLTIVINFGLSGCANSTVFRISFIRERPMSCMCHFFLEHCELSLAERKEGM